MERVAAVMDVALRMAGGTKLKATLLQMAHGLDKAKQVRVGLLEGADYPSDDGARLADAASRVTPEIAAQHPSWKPRLTAWANWQAAHSSQLSVAQIGFWLEFGTSTQKPFPFFRHTIASKSDNWGGHLGRYLKQEEYDAGWALAKLGVLIQGQLQDAIGAGPADNAPLTVFIKGFSHRGIDHGTLQRNVDFEVQ